MVTRALHIAAATVFATAAVAQDEVPRSEFRTLSELTGDGFEPIAAQGGGAALGMYSAPDLYLCFLADRPALQSERQQVLLAELEGAAETRAVPDIPLLCVMTR